VPIRYLLDTDTCSYLIKGRPELVRRRFLEHHPADIATTSIVRFELMYGLQRLPEFHPLQNRTSRFLAGMETVCWDAQAADVYAETRFRLLRMGKPLAEMDLMIAAHAISLNAILVTNNLKHFGRLAPLLQLENWVEQA
jgi:tRNA(fMet)-specific endonuclease VapC